MEDISIHTILFLVLDESNLCLCSYPIGHGRPLMNTCLKSFQGQGGMVLSPANNLQKSGAVNKQQKWGQSNNYCNLLHQLQITTHDQPAGGNECFKKLKIYFLLFFSTLWEKVRWQHPRKMEKCLIAFYILWMGLHEW